ncbi:hypothetical protein FRC03_004944 [Tulasnella sp. 419]|nr:hypothetical protein FRC02_011073 [Tulasnella sp. 418]KAG8961787.1 hypothetical protein FRC03_004944 [Tulasnella sp. 419]
MPQLSSSRLAELTQINAEIEETEREISSLLERAGKLQLRSRELQDRRLYLTTAPPTPPPRPKGIHALPDNVLAHMMLCGVLSNSTSRTVLVRERVDFPLAVSHVCQSWRNLALAIPDLWTYITMNEGRPYDRTLDWMKRSRDLLLDIDLDLRTLSEEGVTQRSFLIAINIILPSLTRWNSLRIRAHLELLLTAFHVFTVPAPRLRSIVFWGWSSQAPSEPPPKIFKSKAPMLERLQLHHMGLDWASSSYSSLTDLSLSFLPLQMRPTLKELSKFLSDTSETLRSLTFIGTVVGMVRSESGISSVARGLASRTCLPVLEHLMFEDVPLSEVFSLFPLIDAPELQSITIVKAEGSPNWKHYVDATAPPWERNQWNPFFSSVTYMAFHDVASSTGLYQSLCRACPGTQIIEIRGPYTEPSVQFLTPNPMMMLPGEEMICPVLHELVVDEVPVELIRAFVETRKHVTPLRSVSATVDGGSVKKTNAMSPAGTSDRKKRFTASGKEALKRLGWEHDSALGRGEVNVNINWEE